MRASHAAAASTSIHSARTSTPRFRATCARRGNECGGPPRARIAPPPGAASASVCERGGPLTLAAIRGGLLTFTGDPFVHGVAATRRYETDAIVAMEDGRITACGA